MLIIGAGVAALFGVLLGAPTLRLRGDYLAIVTLGFGEIVPIVFREAATVTNGINGIARHLPAVAARHRRLHRARRDPLLRHDPGIVTVVLIFAYRLVESRIGRAWEAIREDELAAAANGINTVTTKLLAFALGASTAGIAGVLGAAKLTVVSPDQFTFTVSFTILAMVVLGGMGNFWGVAVGAFTIYTINNVVLHSLNQFFDSINMPILKDIDFIQLQFLLYGLALVGDDAAAPGGPVPEPRRKRELHAEITEAGEDEMTFSEATEEGER